MKQLVSTLLTILVLTACKNRQEAVVDRHFADSLITHYSTPAAVTANAAELSFWKNRINPINTGLVNETKYAAALLGRFHLLGDIKDVHNADSILLQVDSAYNHKEAGVLLSMVSHHILQHRFTEADSCLQKAKAIGLKPYESLAASFDVDFELGRYSNAALELRQMKAANDYGYFFRRARLDHFNGLVDSSLQDMLHAAELAADYPSLRQAALSNAADLYLHTGNMQEAADLYTQCIRLNGADFHSIMGLGWIALVYDKNDSLAERLFHFVQQKTPLPDPLLRLSQAAEASNDSTTQKQAALQFETQATRPQYGNMYHKYLIDLYTGILHQPAKALALARQELHSRATPQTYAWYAWSLAAANRKEEASKIYGQYVSGKPLEGPELYYMGKLMQALNKGYNAQAYFKAADKNRYDLSPAIVQDLHKNLQE
jgi:hypothetical protein